MKLIIGGATGYLGTELVRQSLRMPAITSVVALGRKPVSLPEGTDTAKLRNVVVEDFASYPDDARREFQGAGACIWTIAITPSKSRSMEPEVVKRVCQTFAVDGLRMLVESSPARPFRYLYVSGKLAERDQTKKPILAPEYFLMRGQTENMVLKIGEESNGAVEVGIAKPGLIPKPGISLESIAATMGQALSLPLISTVNREECAAAMLDQVVNGFEKETMTNEDLKRIGKRALRQQAE